jgi:hypothetical protein
MTQGLRDGISTLAEQIWEWLGLLRKEMPRVLGAGLEAKVLRSKGVKRSTVDSVA